MKLTLYKHRPDILNGVLVWRRSTTGAWDDVAGDFAVGELCVGVVNLSGPFAGWTTVLTSRGLFGFVITHSCLVEATT